MHIKDINLIRAFWAVAESGSFSEAARRLGSTQPTLTRQIQSLEQQTGLHLFERSNKGLSITDAGRSLVASSKSTMNAVESFNRVVAGQEDQLEGEIRLTANEIVGYHLLPPAIAELRHLYPNIQVELDINNSFASLSKRDADIAFRMSPPSQNELVGRRLPDLPLGIYGTQGLVDRYGEPESIEQLIRLPFIGFDKELLLIDALKKMGITVAFNDFGVRTDGLLAQLNLVRAGAGYCIIQKALAKHYSELVPVLENAQLPALPFWLVCHADVQYSKKNQTVMRFLGDWFGQRVYEKVLI